MRRKLAGGRLLNLADGSLTPVEILVDDGSQTILAVGKDLGDADETVILHGEILLPGLIDMHVHLRDPGFTEKETIFTGAKAAAAGGFTQIACMPNTNPPLDSVEVLRYVQDESEKAEGARVLPIACITQGQSGRELTDFQSLKEAGAVALSDDGLGVQDGGLMRKAMIKAREAGLPLAIHAEDKTLAGGGVLNYGAAKRLGLPDIPAEAESSMIARDILLAEQTGARLHVCHVSVESAVALIAFAKKRRIRVTAEVTPHHLLLTDEAVLRDDAVFKVNPPLRGESDRQACLAGLLDGTLDIVATDHAPHTKAEKSRSISAAPFGMVGIETAFPLLYTNLVETGKLSLAELVKRMSTKPSQVFGLPGGIIRVGGPADITAVRLDEERVIDGKKFYSKGENTPFQGRTVRGWPSLTMRGGKVVFSDCKLEREEGGKDIG